MSASSIGSVTATILERDLNKLIQEVSAYSTEDKLWIVEGDIANSAGNLALHLAGSIRHFVGHVLGGGNYVRTRDQEFSEKGVVRQEIVDNLLLAIADVQAVLPQLADQDLQQEFPEKIAGNSMSTGMFLLHMISHVNYHLGQVNYHRRLLDQQV